MLHYGGEREKVSAHYVFMNVKYLLRYVYLNFLTMYHVYAFGGNKSIQRICAEASKGETTVERNKTWTDLAKALESQKINFIVLRNFFSRPYHHLGYDDKKKTKILRR